MTPIYKKARIIGKGMDATQTTFIVSDRCECGKSLIGDYIAKLTGGKSANTSDPLIESYASALALHEKPGLAYIHKHKGDFRDFLYAYGTEVARLAGEDIWVRECKDSGATVINGVRRHIELIDAKEPGDVIVYVTGNRGKEDQTAETLDLDMVKISAVATGCQFHVITNNLDTPLDDLHAQCEAIVKG